MCLCALLLRGCQGPRRCLRSTFNLKIILLLLLLLDNDKIATVLAWIWASPRLKPWICESIAVCSKWTQFYALLFLLGSFLLVPILYLRLHWAMHWVGDINVCAWARMWCFDFLIARPVITAVESGVNCFFGYDFVLDIILLFLVIVLAGARYFWESLSSIRSFSLMLPEFTSLSLCEERLWLLSNELSIGVLFKMFISLILHWVCCSVSSWSGIWCPDFSVFAVGHFGFENCVFSRGIILLLSSLFEIISTRAGIVSPTHVIWLIIRLLEKFSLNLTHRELVLRSLWMYLRNIWTIGCRTNLIEAPARVGSGGQFPSWYGRCSSAWNDSMLFMLGRFVFEERLIEVFEFVPLGSLVIVARIWAVQVGRPLHQPWAWSCRTKSWNLSKAKGWVTTILNYRIMVDLPEWQRHCLPSPGLWGQAFWLRERMRQRQDSNSIILQLLSPRWSGMEQTCIIKWTMSLIQKVIKDMINDHIT